MKLIFGAFEGCKIEIIAKPCREEENIFTSKKRRKVIPSFFFVSLAAFFGSIINVGVARPKGRATPNIFHY